MRKTAMPDAEKSPELKALLVTQEQLKAVIAKGEKAPQVIERKRENLREVEARIAELTKAKK